MSTDKQASQVYAIPGIRKKALVRGLPHILVAEDTFVNCEDINNKRIERIPKGHIGIVNEVTDSEGYGDVSVVLDGCIHLRRSKTKDIYA